MPEYFTLPLSPIYIINLAVVDDATSIATGGTSVERCRKLSQQLISRVEPDSTFATACIATCIATGVSRLQDGTLAYHVLLHWTGNMVV